jgi:transcriptional regulator with XRE-family HTH domain
MTRPIEIPTPRRKFYPISSEREFRLRRGITLSEAARLAGLSLARASEIERHPRRARPGELERLRVAVDRAALERTGAEP